MFKIYYKPTSLLSYVRYLDQIKIPYNTYYNNDSFNGSLIKHMPKGVDIQSHEWYAIPGSSTMIAVYNIPLDSAFFRLNYVIQPSNKKNTSPLSSHTYGTLP
jgi:hypothetical protein